jgi:hypothetical protein
VKLLNRSTSQYRYQSADALLPLGAGIACIALIVECIDMDSLFQLDWLEGQPVSFLVLFLNAFHLAPYKEKHNHLSSFCPWAFLVGKYPESIVLLKGGVLMRTYSFVCPYLGSASVESINAVSFFFNEAIKI